MTAPDAASADEFGSSVAISGPVAIVGVIYDDCPPGALCGSAHFFRRGDVGWAWEQKIVSSDVAANDEFGAAVAIDGNVAVVGAPKDDCAAGGNCGAAYIFRFDGASWVQEQKLTASDAAGADYFGDSVSVSGSVIVVGARLDNCADGGPDCGSAYVFRFNGSRWAEEQRLRAADAAWYDEFGTAVSISGNVIIAGAPLGDCVSTGGDCGAAYVFRFNGSLWVEERKLVGPDTTPDDRLGASVAASGDVLVVGAPRADCAGPYFGCGAAHVFRYTGASWIYEQKLTGADGEPGDSFGHSVAIWNEIAVAGALGVDCTTSYSYCGAAYVFRFNGVSWAEQQKLITPDEAVDWELGISVGVSDDAVVVGADRENCGAGFRCGSAYVFKCTPPAVPGDFTGDGAFNLADVSALVDCITGPGVLISDTACAVADTDGDEDVDLGDLADLQRQFGM